MLPSLLLASSWIPLAAALAPPPGPQDEPIPFERAREAFAEAQGASDADGGALWGRALWGPMLFADRATRVVVANRADPSGELGEVEGVWVGVLPEEVGLANTATRWAGTEWTMVLWPLPGDGVQRRKLLAHELYHRIQDELGLPGRDASNPQLDGEAGRVSLRGEAQALAAALRAEGAARRAAAGDALLLRSARQARFPGSAESERTLELNEGLAEYTGWCLSGLAPEARAGAVARALEERIGPGGLYARGFAYATGPAYGVLLDGLRPGWRAELEATSDLTRLLAGALAWTAPEDLEARAAEALERHDGARIRAEEHERETVRVERERAQRARFVAGPVLVLAATPALDFTFDPNGVESLAGEGSVYDPFRAVDAWGILEVTSGGALLRRLAEGRVELVVPAPSAGDDAHGHPLRGDGWTLELADGWRLATGPRAGDRVVAR